MLSPSGKIRPLYREEVVLGPPDSGHWHGASPESSMTHIVRTNYKGDTQINLLGPVTDEEYGAAGQ